MEWCSRARPPRTQQPRDLAEVARDALQLEVDEGVEAEDGRELSVVGERDRHAVLGLDGRHAAVSSEPPSREVEGRLGRVGEDQAAAAVDDLRGVPPPPRASSSTDSTSSSANKRWNGASGVQKPWTQSSDSAASKYAKSGGDSSAQRLTMSSVAAEGRESAWGARGSGISSLLTRFVLAATVAGYWVRGQGSGQWCDSFDQ